MDYEFLADATELTLTPEEYDTIVDFIENAHKADLENLGIDKTTIEKLRKYFHRNTFSAEENIKITLTNYMTNTLFGILLDLQLNDQHAEIEKLDEMVLKFEQWSKEFQFLYGKNNKELFM